MDTPEADDFEAVSGRGVKGTINGRRYIGGNAAFMEESGVDISPLADTAERLADEGKTPLFLPRTESCWG